MELTETIEQYQKRLDKLNENPFDHEYGNKLAVLKAEHQIRVNRILYLNSLENGKGNNGESIVECSRISISQQEASTREHKRRNHSA